MRDDINAKMRFNVLTLNHDRVTPNEVGVWVNAMTKAYW